MHKDLGLRVQNYIFFSKNGRLLSIIYLIMVHIVPTVYGEKIHIVPKFHMHVQEVKCFSCYYPFVFQAVIYIKNISHGFGMSIAVIYRENFFVIETF